MSTRIERTRAALTAATAARNALENEIDELLAEHESAVESEERFRTERDAHKATTKLLSQAGALLAEAAKRVEAGVGPLDLDEPLEIHDLRTLAIDMRDLANEIDGLDEIED